MASIFQPTLSEPQAVESPRGAVQDNTSAQIVRAVGKGIEVAAGIKDRNTLERVGNELEDISIQEEQFRETQVALEEQILTTRDKQVIDSVNEELLKLRAEYAEFLVKLVKQSEVPVYIIITMRP